MLYLIQSYWLWLLLALILGLAVGWVTSVVGRGRPPEGWLPPWLRWAGAFFLAGLVVALFKWLPGRGGLHLETALLLFGSYIAGCFVSVLLQPSVAREAVEEEPAVAPTAIGVPVGPAPPPTPADDLKRIAGIGPKYEALLHDLGVYRFSQIADWTEDDVARVNDRLDFSGRIERERWIEQARLLAAGIETDFSSRVRREGRPRDRPLSDDAWAALEDALPRAAPAVADEAVYAGRRPLGLVEPQIGNKPDNLQYISGIGPRNEEHLHALGIWHFHQIAAWTPENVAWVGGYLEFPGRIEDERWVEQARELVAGRHTEFSRRKAEELGEEASTELR